MKDVLSCLLYTLVIPQWPLHVSLQNPTKAFWLELAVRQVCVQHIFPLSHYLRISKNKSPIVCNCPSKYYSLLSNGKIAEIIQELQLCQVNKQSDIFHS